MDHPLFVSWPSEGKVAANWGDKLNPILVQALSGREVSNSKPATGWDGRSVYRVIGSGLANTRPHHEVWGMGFKFFSEKINAPPRKIHAVRGPLTRGKLISMGIDCPGVFGDPAVLYPLIYYPTIQIVYDIGIIRHINEQELPEDTFPISPEIHRLNIDITGEINSVVDAILSCRMIVSSSLHGIIAAHAYGVPAFQRFGIRRRDCRPAMASSSTIISQASESHRMSNAPLMGAEGYLGPNVTR
ncbi:polysaccharide pyruvyl transferase family protein [Roseococcus sp. SYP-B2431]|uniref:polysaccharide pyruvyl transferase family protein n=1 Tax=Roseococcus sp. SYP-B2431 TaxID=2496640 RepID=UPI0013F3D23F|nr:polysaccharide pyruvyl transferase family protein [Roseococcus sp. SYP-B2431]